MTDQPSTVTLDLLRCQVAALLSQIDTATLPTPDRIRSGRSEQHPGREWRPARGWQVFTVEDDCHEFVYVDHACDNLNYRFGEPGDWEALRVDDARRIGLAFLAAAQRAEELLARRTVADVPQPPTVLVPRPQRRNPA